MARKGKLKMKADSASLKRGPCIHLLRVDVCVQRHNLHCHFESTQQPRYRAKDKKQETESSKGCWTERTHAATTSRACSSQISKWWCCKRDMNFAKNYKVYFNFFVCSQFHGRTLSCPAYVNYLIKDVFVFNEISQAAVGLPCSVLWNK